MNFNKRGNHHKTQVGGFLSIIIKIFIRVYVLLTLKSLLFLEENQNTSVESMETEMPLVNYNETDHFVFSVIRE